MSNLSAWYRNLSAREQKLLGVMTLLIVGCVAYYNVWIPTNRNLHEAQIAYAQQSNLLQWMQANESLAQPSQASAVPANDTTPLPVLVTRTTKDSGLPIARLDANADGKAILTLDHVSFNRMIVWLDKFQHDHNVTLLSANITAADTPGEVNATLQLEK